MPASIVCAALVAMSLWERSILAVLMGDEVASDIEAEASLSDPHPDALLRYLFRPIRNRYPPAKSNVRITSWFQFTISVTSLNTLDG